jgi:gas vesicle protein
MSESNTKTLCATSVGVGILIGAGIALLCAPRTGKETRELIGKKAGELKKTLGSWASCDGEECDQEEGSDNQQSAQSKDGQNKDKNADQSAMAKTDQTKGDQNKQDQNKNNNQQNQQGQNNQGKPANAPQPAQARA